MKPCFTSAIGAAVFLSQVGSTHLLAQGYGPQAIWRPSVLGPMRFPLLSANCKAPLTYYMDQLDHLQSVDIRNPSLHTQQRTWVTDYLITCASTGNTASTLGVFVGSNELVQWVTSCTRFKAGFRF